MWLQNKQLISEYEYFEKNIKFRDEIFAYKNACEQKLL